MRFFILLADGIRKNKILHGSSVPFICALLSNTGRNNMQHKTHVSMVQVRNFWQLIYNVIVVVYNDRAFRSLYRSMEVFSSFLTMVEVAQDVGGVITLDGCNFK